VDTLLSFCDDDYGKVFERLRTWRNGRAESAGEFPDDALLRDKLDAFRRAREERDEQRPEAKSCNAGSSTWPLLLGAFLTILVMHKPFAYYHAYPKLVKLQILSIETNIESSTSN
jgi:hypothetical protein